MSAQVISTATNHPTESRACSLLDPKATAEMTQAVADPKLLAVYNAQVHLLRGVHATAMVRGQGGIEYGIGERAREVPMILDFARPDLIRVTGVFDGSRGFEMASDGHEFRLLVPEDGRRTFLVGPVDAPAESKKPRENLRPQPFMEALRWQEGTASATQTASVEENGLRTLDIDLSPSRNGGRTAAIEFDLSSGEVNSLMTYDATGKPLSRARYSEWRRVESSPAGPSEGCFPRRIQFVQFDRDLELDLRILDIDFNPQFPRDYFHPNPPRGIPIVRAISEVASQ